MTNTSTTLNTSTLNSNTSLSTLNTNKSASELLLMSSKYIYKSSQLLNIRLLPLCKLKLKLPYIQNVTLN